MYKMSKRQIDNEITKGREPIYRDEKIVYGLDRQGEKITDQIIKLEIEIQGYLKLGWDREYAYLVAIG